MNTVQPQDIAERYISALEDFAEFGQETRLIQAYDLARDALQEGISLAEISGIHHVALQELFDASANPMERLERLEQFFLEVIAVYDMALRGYQSNVQSLQAENLKRRGTEARLRELSDELKRQRDSLDIQVRGRTAELAEKASDLVRANLQLQHANREQAEFTYAISHDLKSPVNTIGMLINELSLGYGGLFDEEGRELIDLAVQTVGRMGDLIEDVLSYSRTVERGFSVEPVDLNQLFADLTSDLLGDITSHAVQLEAAELPVVSGNALQLRILFHNLLSNAIKFRDPERPLRIRVSGTADPATGSLRISVSDNGIGIPPEYHKQIFALFQRLHTHDTYPGSGLGLALCKRIALNHKGVIDLSSAPGRGSTFSLVVTGGAYDS
ncbi:sensor histidine kinase [Leisingera sp. S232]|uniref:sensor histidine kinase n=1 Tax=Leisingera sp. S232 TaxID=3415132 RepID=UPI003C7C0E2B